jgi:predicted ester cyclase
MGIPTSPLQGSFARRFAQEWVDGWNSHNLDRILAHYDENVCLVSPVALRLLNNGNGVVQGKGALQEYFRRGLEAFPNLHFDLIDVLWGMETIVLYYANQERGTKTAEVMLLTPAGRVRCVWANYDQ